MATAINPLQLSNDKYQKPDASTDEVLTSPSYPSTGELVEEAFQLKTVNTQLSNDLGQKPEV
jgi:hypothetical protein